ncbi:hypothetical protein EMIHUDRAFT_457684, partial [Emiliania huxleyi CCMP1516]|uniref:Lipid-binding serum glycoprotein C-terminal domain-containing protein n=2 Tax=Emiliania huxleyi TaxID=2903 RepID=A0A0D3JMW0_EMIH1
MSWLVLLLPLAAVAHEYEFPADRVLSALSDGGCPPGSGLRSWLCDAHIDIDHYELDNVGGFNIKLDGVRCSTFKVGDLSSAVSRRGAHNVTLSVAADELSFNCSIRRLDAKQIAFPHAEAIGKGTAGISGATLRAGLVAHLTEGVPRSVVTDERNCSLAVDPKRVELDLTGNIWIKLINAIKGVLIQTVVGQLPSIADAALAPLVSNLTAYAEAAPPPELPEPPYKPALANWSASEAVAVADYVLNDVVGTDGPLGLNRIAELLTNGTGSLALNASGLLPPLELPVSRLGNLSLNVSLLNLSHLPSFDELNLLIPSPSEPLTLRAAAGMTKLGPGALIQNSLLITARWRVEPLVGLNDVLAALPAAAPWLVGVLTHHSGIANFSLPPVSLPLGPLLGHGPAPRPLLLGVHVHRLSVGGLETVRRLELLKPLAAEPTGLESAAALGRLSLAADVEFRLALSGRGSSCLAQQLLYASLTSLGAALTLDSLDERLVAELNAEIAGTLRRLWAPSCPPRVPSRPSIVDFRNTSGPAAPFARARATVDAYGAAGVDRFVRRVLPSGELRMARLLDVLLTDELLGRISVRLDGLHVRGLDSLFDLDVLRPDSADGHLLHHRVGLGGNGSGGGRNGSLQLRLGAAVRFGRAAAHEYEVLVRVRAAVLKLGTRLVLDSGSFLATTFGELVASLGSCLLCDVVGLDLAANDTSLRAQGSDGLELEVTPRGQSRAAVLAGRAFAPSVTLPLGRLANDALHAAAGGLLLVTGTALLLLLLCGAGVSGCVRRRRWLEPLRARLLEASPLALTALGPRAAALAPAEEAPPARAWEYEADSLASRYREVRLARYGLPLLICTNVALFVAGNVLPGATVRLSVAVAGDSIELPTIKKFALVDTAYLLSTLIAFLSGVWPYIKLSLMALCWAAPATHLSPLWRERLLRAVDALGKWSYLDTMMLVVFTVAFHIPFDLPSTSPAAPRL